MALPQERLDPAEVAEGEGAADAAAVEGEDAFGPGTEQMLVARPAVHRTGRPGHVAT